MPEWYYIRCICSRAASTTRSHEVLRRTVRSNSNNSMATLDINKDFMLYVAEWFEGQQSPLFQSDQKFAAFDVLTLYCLWINNLPLNHMVPSLYREGTESVATPTCGFNYSLWRGESARQKQTYGSRTSDPRCFPFLCRDELTAKEEHTGNKAWPDTECMFAIQNYHCFFKCFPLGKEHVAPFGHALKIKFISRWLIFCVHVVPLQLLFRDDQWIAVRPLEKKGQAEHPSNLPAPVVPPLLYTWRDPSLFNILCPWSSQFVYNPSSTFQHFFFFNPFHSPDIFF